MKKVFDKYDHDGRTKEKKVYLNPATRVLLEKYQRELAHEYEEGGVKEWLEKENDERRRRGLPPLDLRRLEDKFVVTHDPDLLGPMRKTKQDLAIDKIAEKYLREHGEDKHKHLAFQTKKRT